MPYSQRCESLAEKRAGALVSGRRDAKHRLGMEERAAGEAGDAADPRSGEAAPSSIDIVKIIALFNDDPMAQKIVIGMMEGARGQELQDLCGLGKTSTKASARRSGGALKAGAMKNGL